MTHFPVMVTFLLPEGQTEPPLDDELEALVEPLLAPYDENIDVPEYERECWCVGRQARDEAAKKAREEIGPPPGDMFHDDNDAFVAWERRYDERRAQLRAADPTATQADPECDDCHGTGRDKTTYNPVSKWDWYVVGGRWDDMIEGNVVSVADLLARPDNEWITSALLTPDGDWHQQGRMGWFAIMTERKTTADWYDEVRGHLRQWPTALVAYVDCHI